MNNQLVFLFALCIEIIYALLFIATIKSPRFRFWPPPRLLSWQFFTAWLLASLVGVVFLYLGWLNSESFILPSLRYRLPFALAFFAMASALGTWADTVFKLKSTLGLVDHLVTHGPYQYSRNPQYITDTLAIVGFMILANSWMVCILGLVGIGLYILAPLTEEPWLAEKYGESYLEYKDRVPRFIGFSWRKTSLPE